MDELGKTIRDCIITAVIVFIILFCTFTYVGIKEISATRKAKQIETGDTFKVEYVSENPYENRIVVEGNVISKQGNYIQYVNKNGDTTSTNIREVYRFPKKFRITVIKQK